MNCSSRFCNFLAVGLCAAFLASCAGQPPAGDSQAAQHEPSPPISQQRAVVALLDHAEQAAREGRSQQSAVAIERALRLEPDNAALWHRLAVVRMEQGQYEQADAMAQKSNLLAGGDRKLRISNWRLIANARRALGKYGAAQEAEQSADTLAAEEKKAHRFWRR